jgi:hypothetical protein
LLFWTERKPALHRWNVNLALRVLAWTHAQAYRKSALRIQIWTHAQAYRKPALRIQVWTHAQAYRKSALRIQVWTHDGSSLAACCTCRQIREICGFPLGLLHPEDRCLQADRVSGPPKPCYYRVAVSLQTAGMLCKIQFKIIDTITRIWDNKRKVEKRDEK